MNDLERLRKEKEHHLSSLNEYARRRGEKKMELTVKASLYRIESGMTLEKGDEKVLAQAYRDLEEERDALVEFLRVVRHNDYWTDWIKLSEALRKEIESDA